MGIEQKHGHLVGCLTALIVVAAGCVDDDPRPVAKNAEQFGDIPMPEFAASKRSQLGKQHGVGPALFTAIECENTYVEDSAAPSPPLPSLWVQQDDRLMRVDGLSSIRDGTDEPWAERSWSPDFRDGGVRLVCEGERRSRPGAGEAYLTYLYPRVLLDGVEWLLPAPRDITIAEKEELEAMGADVWTEEKAQRLIELHPNRWSGDWGPYWTNAIAWAKDAGHSDLEYELRRRYQPVGQCGNDTYPGQIRDELRNHCLLTGRFDCVAALWGWTRPPLPQPAYTQPWDLPPDVDAVRYQLGILLRFPGSFRSDIEAQTPNYQDRKFLRDFFDRAVELATDDDTDAYTRHQLAILAYEAASRSADLTHMKNAPDRKLSSLMVPDRVFEQELREIAEHEWLPSATRARFLRQADRLDTLIRLEEAEDWEALRAEAKGDGIGPTLWIHVGPDASAFTTKPR